MDREIPYEENSVCDGCGHIGAYDFVGDYYCDDCITCGVDGIVRINGLRNLWFRFLDWMKSVIARWN